MTTIKTYPTSPQRKAICGAKTTVTVALTASNAVRADHANPGGDPRFRPHRPI